MTLDAAAYKEQERRAYDAIASEWQTHMAEKTAAYSRGLLSRLKPSAGARLLDLACGTGRLSRDAAFDYGCRVTAVDLSEGMLRQARRLTNGRGEIDFRQGDAETLEFDTETFQFVTAGLGLMYFPDARRALSEVRRVLEQGGRAGFVVWSRMEEIACIRVLISAMAEVLARPAVRALVRIPWLGERLLVAATRETIPGKGPSPSRFGDPPRVRQILSSSGFEEIEITPHTEIWRYRDVDEYWEGFVKATPAPPCQSGLSKEQTAQVRARLRRKMTPYESEGGYAFPMTALLVTARTR